MHIEVGDLVSSKKNLDRMGVVVKKSSVNSVAMSAHAKEIMSGWYVYYVYFPNEGYSGPYHSSELRLNQHLENNQ